MCCPAHGDRGLGLRLGLRRHLRLPLRLPLRSADRKPSVDEGLPKQRGIRSGLRQVFADACPHRYARKLHKVVVVAVAVVIVEVKVIANN